MKTRILTSIALALVVPAAMASTSATSTLTIGANVDDACVVSSDSLGFTNFNPITSEGNTTTANISVICTSGTAYSIGLDAGIHAVDSQRYLSDGAHTVAYNLYSDAAGYYPWDNSNPNNVAGTGTGSTQTFTVYGMIPTQTNAFPGTNYSDSVSISVYY